MSGIGEYSRTLYVWYTVDGWYCQAGCFFGTECEFKSSVIAKYGEDHKYIKALELLKS